MSGIEDETNIAGISIPGTHDSCARYESVRTQCQWFSIIQQLNRGIRFVDIRCRYRTDAESGRKQNIYFPVHHSDKYQYFLFEEVQAQCVAFLDANPTEFILMNVQMEEPNGQTGGVENGELFAEKFLELIEPYKNYWYMKDGIRLDRHQGIYYPNLPAIKDVRNHIVLIRSYENTGSGRYGVGWGRNLAEGGFLWNGFNHDGESHNLIFQTQNGWQAWHGSDKGDKVEEYIKAAKDNAAEGLFTFNWASYASDLGPGGNAEGMNPRLQNFLKKYSFDLPLGVLVLDFTGNTGDGGDSLENLIIEHQKHQKPNYSYGGLPKWLLKTSA
jgi:1-phosphatidylinositol phosphodiesterase